MRRRWASSVNPYLGAQPIAVDQDYKNPRAYQAGAGSSGRSSTGVTVAADLTYVKTDRLQRNRELNLAVPVPRADRSGAAPDLSDGAVRATALGSVQVRESSAGRSTRP